MKKDIERIYKCIEEQKFCHQAREHLNLFGEKYDYPEKVNSHFERVAKKPGDTIMIASETVPGLYTAQNRYYSSSTIHRRNGFWSCILSTRKSDKD